jgi:hypothetical protein
VDVGQQQAPLPRYGEADNGCLDHRLTSIFPSDSVVPAGRTIDEQHVDYTAKPGHVGGFGALVDRVGRGMPRAVACGKEYTVVATYPYQGAECRPWLVTGAAGC